MARTSWIIVVSCLLFSWDHPSRADILSFRANQLTVLQKGGKSYSGALSWAPGWDIDDTLGIRAMVGAALIKGVASNFLAIDGELLLTYSGFKPWGIEVGPGYQSWMGSGGGSGFSANLLGSYNLTDSFHLFAGYSPLFAPSNFTHELRVGAGIAF